MSRVPHLFSAHSASKRMKRIELVAAAVVLLVMTSSIQAAQTLSPEQRAEIVEVHNRLRRSVHPPAADMNLLTWNSRLEQLAQQAANSCSLSHNFGGPYTGLGENIYKGSRSSISEIVSLFFAEQGAFDFTVGGVCNIGRTQNTLASTGCGHYLQVVAANAAEVGCVIANCTQTAAGSPVENMLVCEYDAQYQTLLPYTQGQPCSRCPNPHSHCARGLCANYTTAVNVTGNATCSLLCMNCGILMDLGSGGCLCNCSAGFTGPVCNVKQAADVALPPGCSACRAQATPCRTGANETSSISSSGGSSTTCKCACPPDYRGSRCAAPRDAYDQGLLVGLRGPPICSGGRCGPLPPPMEPQQFGQRVWPALSGLLAAAVNAFCGANATTFAVCCPNVSYPGGGGGRALVQSGDFAFLEDSLTVGESQDLTVAVYATAQASNSMCGGGPTALPGRPTTPVPYWVLNAAIQTAQSTVSANLTNCCSVEVSTLQQYSAVADAAASGGDVTTATLIVGKSGQHINTSIVLLLLMLLANIVADSCSLLRGQ